MKSPKPLRPAVGKIVLLAAYVLALAVFYWKYVPLVPAFQAVLLPVLIAVAAVATIDEKSGLLAFVFVFPLINNLPYFFGIAEPIPFAPTALLLFLFFTGGRLVRGLRGRGAPRLGEPIFRPLGLASAFVAVSAVITFWRYANFFPLGSGRVLEWAVNAHGVTSGGAFMSIVFSALNYLTAFAFFFIFLRTDRSRPFLLKALTALGLGALISCAFGFFQLAGHLKLGNNPLSIVNEIINATFKDAMAFGCFLSMVIPLAIGGILSLRGARRAGAAILTAAAAVLILAAGSKSALFGVLAGLAFFAGLAGATFIRRRRETGAPRPGFRPSLRLAGVILAALVVAGGGGLLAVRSGLFRHVLLTRTIARLPGTKYQLAQRINTLWSLAGDCLKAYPLTGVGVGTYIIESSNFTARAGGSLKDLPDSAENYFLQAAAELGLPGLAVFIWFFWEIFRKARAAWRTSSPRSPDRWLLAGAISGTIAYAFNTLTHSYIGSFEIKYAFWIIVAAIYILGGREDPVEPRGAAADPGRIRRGRAAAATVVILFGAVHLWNSTHALSLARTMERFPIPREVGVDKIEKTEDGREFRWTREYGGLPVQVESRSLIVQIHASHPDIGSAPVRVRISLAPDVFHRGRTLKELTLSASDWREIVLDVPAEDVGRSRILFFDVGRTWNPSKTTGAPDSRDLGVAIGPIRFR